MKSEELKKLERRLINGGWGEMERGTYPRPALWDWLKIEHPEITKEYCGWFDENCRGKGN